MPSECPERDRRDGEHSVERIFNAHALGSQSAHTCDDLTLCFSERLHTTFLSDP